MASLVGCAAALLACGDSTSGRPDVGSVAMDATTGSMPVGPEGATIVSDDGRLRLEIPAGALESSVAIGVTGPGSSPAGAVSPVYEIGPTGTMFAIPATLSIRYELAELDGATPDDLMLATHEGASGWRAVDGNAHDESTRRITGSIEHLSPYALVLDDVVRDGGSADDAGGHGDASRDADTVDAGVAPTDGGAPSDATPSIDGDTSHDAAAPADAGRRDMGSGSPDAGPDCPAGASCCRSPAGMRACTGGTRCEVCGGFATCLGPSELCCAGSVCDASIYVCLTCGDEQYCAEPGSACCGRNACNRGEACLECPGREPTCTEPDGICCGPGICVEGNVCLECIPSCGSPGQFCCGGNVCEAGQLCNDCVPGEEYCTWSPVSC